MQSSTIPTPISGAHDSTPSRVDPGRLTIYAAAMAAATRGAQQLLPTTAILGHDAPATPAQRRRARQRGAATCARPTFAAARGARAVHGQS
jgi:hypothetical protein